MLRRSLFRGRGGRGRRFNGGAGRAQRFTAALIAATVLILAAGVTAAAQNPPAQSNDVPAVQAYLYVAGTWPDPVYFRPSALNDQISEFAIAPTTSALTRIGAVPNSNPSFPGGIFALAQGGPWLFVDGGAGGPKQVYRIDADGTLGVPTPALTEPSSAVVAADPIGNWTIWRQNLYRVASNGALTNPRALPFQCFLYPLHSGAALMGSFFDPSGTLFFALPVPNYLPSCEGVYRFDPMAGTFSPATNVAPELKQPGLTYLGFDASGTHFYAARGLGEVGSVAPAEVLVFDVDPAAGSVTLHSRGAQIAWHNAVYAGGFIFARKWPSIYVYRVDPTTQAITDTGQRAATAVGWDIMMAADANTNTLAVPSPQENQVYVYHWDTDTGALTPAPGSPYPTGTAPWIALIVSRVVPMPLGGF